MLNRYPSRRQPLDAGFLNARLTGAMSYDRTAGYFSSSILEVAGVPRGTSRWLAGFGHHGQVPRIDLRDPLNSIFYRGARFALVAAGGYWPSEQPQVIGSRS